MTDTCKMSQEYLRIQSEEPLVPLEYFQTHPLYLATRAKIRAAAAAAPKTSASLTNSIADAHARLIEVLVQIGPAYQICAFDPDAQDIRQRAEHVQSILKAVAKYIETVVHDTASNCSDFDRRIADLIHDAAGDISGSIQRAAEQMEG